MFKRRPIPDYQIELPWRYLDCPVLGVWRLMVQDADNEARNIDHNLADLNTEQTRLN